MNFKRCCIILLTFCFFSCGVKSPPLVPPESVIPGYEEKFLGTLSKEEKKPEAENMDDEEE